MGCFLVFKMKTIKIHYRFFLNTVINLMLRFITVELALLLYFLLLRKLKEQGLIFSGVRGAML